MTFCTGDRVEKVTGYKFPGTVVAHFKKLNGDERYVVEMDGYGLLHIFNDSQLALRPIVDE